MVVVIVTSAFINTKVAKERKKEVNIPSMIAGPGSACHTSFLISFIMIPYMIHFKVRSSSLMHIILSIELPLVASTSLNPLK